MAPGLVRNPTDFQLQASNSSNLNNSENFVNFLIIFRVLLKKNKKKIYPTKVNSVRKEFSFLCLIKFDR